MEEPSKYAIHEAARNGNISAIESLLSANPKLSGRRDDDDRLPIHWAVSHGHLNIAVLLSGGETFDPDVQDGSGWTPLMIAVSLKDQDELVDLFLQKGADVNSQSFNGQTALHFAASKNNLDVVRKLLNNKPPASTRVRDKRGQYAIHRAAAVGSVPIVELLLKSRSPLNFADVAGQTPLHHAVAEGHAGAETDKRDTDGSMAMELAPDAQILKFILQSAEREGIEL